jgi:MFS transporter, DHA1 family, solute carrier family 18 (vesicular amine transporter), member 1/2
MFVLLAVAESLVVGISPLLPTYKSHLSLSGFGVSALLASTSLALLIFAVPAGLIADRIGVRRLTIISGVILAFASVAEADPFSFAWLLIVRIAIGAAAGVFWTSGLAWLAGLPDGHSSALGTGITMAGVGLVLGPGFLGLAAQAFGIGAPFIIIGVIIGAATAALAAAGHRPLPVADEAMPPSLAGVMRAAKRRPDLRSALIALSASAIASGTLAVLVPLELHQAGASIGTIGLILFVTGLGYVVASAVIARVGGRLVSIGAVMIASAAIGTFLIPASLSRSAVLLVLTLALITPFRGALATLCYQLGSRAAGDGVGAASIIGCLNSLWGAVSVCSPLAAGAIYDAAGGRAAFACAQVVVLMAAGATALSRRHSLIASPVADATAASSTAAAAGPAPSSSPPARR